MAWLGPMGLSRIGVTARMLILALDRRVFHGVAFSSDGRQLVTLNSKKQVRVWDRTTWEERVAFENSQQLCLAGGG